MSVPSEQMIESTLLVLAWAKNEAKNDEDRRILGNARFLVMEFYERAPEET